MGRFHRRNFRPPDFRPGKCGTFFGARPNFGLSRRGGRGEFCGRPEAWQKSAMADLGRNFQRRPDGLAATRERPVVADMIGSAEKGTLLAGRDRRTIPGYYLGLYGRSARGQGEPKRLVLARRIRCPSRGGATFSRKPVVQNPRIRSLPVKIGLSPRGLRSARAQGVGFLGFAGTNVITADFRTSTACGTLVRGRFRGGRFLVWGGPGPRLRGHNQSPLTGQRAPRAGPKRQSNVGEPPWGQSHFRRCGQGARKTARQTRCLAPRERGKKN